MSDVFLTDLEAAMRTAKAMQQSRVPIHIFVLAKLIAGYRQSLEATDLERDAREFLQVRRAR